MLLTWGFTPKVLGYVPNVRGVITGLADRMPHPLHGGTNAAVSNIPLLRAVLPGELGDVVGQLPVLRFVAQELSARLETPVTAAAYEERPPRGAVSRQPRWAWDTTFLGSFTGTLRKEVVGVTPMG